MKDSVMLEKLKQGWRAFEHDPPGQRFRQRFKRSQQSDRSVVYKLAFVASGVLIMALGVFLLAVPGPGVLVVFIGAGLVAQVSFSAARALDWCELRARKLAAWSLRGWRRASPVMKILSVLLVGVFVSTAGLAAYALLVAK
ncbi:MAG: PGPGW domain-containing protein [Gammaproteobacteria bacterium]